MSITAWFVIGAIGVILIYDLFASLKWGVGETISKFVYEKSGEQRWIPFGIGLLVAHLLGL